jgi:hypothetical protein
VPPHQRGVVDGAGRAEPQRLEGEAREGVGQVAADHVDVVARDREGADVAAGAGDEAVERGGDVVGELTHLDLHSQHL